MTRLLAILKLSSFFLVCLVLVPAQILARHLPGVRTTYFIPYFWHKIVCACFGLNVIVEGAPCRDGHVVYVSNHLSYLDIPVIGGVLRASFVAKKDVEGWPVFGFLAKLQNTVFIKRSRSAAAQEKDSVGGQIDQGVNLIIFPEGTSTDGREVVPFKSSLFSLMLQDTQSTLKVQPFTILIKTVDGQAPDTQDLRDIYSWHRDMTTELPDHLWRFAKSKGATIILRFHTPVLPHEHEDRKALAKICHKAVAGGLESASEVRNVA